MKKTKKMGDVYQRLYDVIISRKDSNSADSYTASLFKKGRGKICNKLGEEAIETVVAALAEKQENVVHESADMLFHLFVLWAEMGIDPQEVSNKLEDRFGISGMEEKKARSNSC